MRPLPLGRRLSSAALAVLAAGAGWAALRPEPAPPALAAATRPVLSPERLPAVLAEAQGTVELEAAVDELLGDLASCVVVREGDRPVLLRRPQEVLTPASTQKLFVALAALRALGPDFRYQTQLVTRSRPDAGGALPALWLVGSGDPFLATPEYAAYLAERLRTRDRPLTPLAGLADDLAAAGVRSVGDIVGDDSRYDRARTVPTWKATYVTDNEVGPLGALIVDSGFSDFVPPERRAEDPAVHAAGELARLLEERGIEVRGEVRSGTAPDGAAVVGTVRSAPASEVVKAMVAESDNTAAELIVRELGRQVAGEGSTSVGTNVVAAEIAALGVPIEGVHLGDGSGLEVTNTATCAALDAALRAGDEVRDLLAVAGRSGTLVRRLVDTPYEGRVAAKTGSLKGVTGLAGFIDGRRRLSFALLAQGDFTSGEGRRLQDRLLFLLAHYPGPQP